MLWLNGNQSIKNIFLNDYIRVAKNCGFNIRKIFQYSKNSCVFLTSNNTVIKILNPFLAKYQIKNYLFANDIFLKFGIATPYNLSIKKDGDFYIIESQYIEFKSFFNKKSLAEADAAFFKFFSKLSKAKRIKFGLFSLRNSLPPAFINCDYLEYWDKQFDYFLKKISNGDFRNNAKKYYELLRKKIKISQQFILSHSDISPKHIFIYKSKIGCVDLEEAMYLDSSFMWAIWYVRTIHERKNKLDKIFFNEFVSRNLDFDLFIFHVYRELLIQYYYEKSHNNFFRDYSKILKNIQLILRVSRSV
ncbi:MAG: hypothetical protein AB1465_06655 [Patescibacteria group bacterium]